MSETTCLITGGAGNLACQLTWKLPEFDRLVLFDQAEQPVAPVASGAEYRRGDLTEPGSLAKLLDEVRPRVVFHLASLLSDSTERDRRRGWAVNATGGLETLEAAIASRTRIVIFPSSLASFGGPLSDPLPEDGPQWPDGLYGVTKVAVERLGVYYHRRHGLDFRGLRLPIVVSPLAHPGAASAYVSRALIEAKRSGEFTFHVREETRPSIIHIEDALSALAELSRARPERLSKRVYNLFACAPSAGEIAAAIQRRAPNFRPRFEPRGELVSLIESWPRRIDDRAARADWDWRPRYDLDRIVEDFLARDDLPSSTPGGNRAS